MDVMRALLALLVAFGHIWILFVRDYAPTGSRTVQALYGLAGFAHPAVVMFFVLSGYWITRSVMRRAAGEWSWNGYLADRLGRLLPVLVPALLLGGLLDWLSINLLHSPTHLGLTGSWVLHKDVAADLSLLTFLGNLIFLEGILVHSFGTNGPLWSLAAEFWFYLWFPALYLLIRQRRISWALPTLLLVLLAPQLALYFAQWLCGAALVFVQARARPRVG
jgi:peptidoglycan/LPS O-acetylase OafA/YrhL